MVRPKRKSLGPTIIDVARESDVSLATVSRVLNNSPKVARETRDAVLGAIKRLGFTPNASARNLSGRKNNALGVIFHQMTSGFYATVMSGIELEARSSGFHVLVTITHHTDPDRGRYFDMLNEARVDGLIVLDSTLSEDTMSRLKSYNRPIVLIQKKWADDTVSTVMCDNEGGARAAMDLLIGRGTRRVLLVAGPPEAEDSELRMNGCRQALRERGLSKADVDVITGSYSAQEALRAFREYLRSHDVPKAIFAFNDDMALAIMKELRLTGVKVPGDTAVVGFDGIDAADYMGLTTVQMPMMELGAEAVRLAIRRIRQPKEPAAHVVKPCALVIRESC
jgi:LacI family transcriptional regulator